MAINGWSRVRILLTILSLSKMTKPGRKRKTGARYPSGDLVRHRDSPRSVAASMPHRRTVPADDRHDHRAESELGRMAMRGQITATQFDAGRRFQAITVAYHAVIGAPARLGATSGKAYQCRAEAICEPCECRRRQDQCEAAVRRLNDVLALHAVMQVAFHDQPCPRGWEDTLRVGLNALARHLGLTAHGKRA